MQRLAQHAELSGDASLVHFTTHCIMAALSSMSCEPDRELGATGPAFRSCCVSHAALPANIALLPLQVPGQTVEMLLLKYARASQRSPTDSTVVFVAR